MYKCPLCGKKFDSKSDLDHHASNHFRILQRLGILDLQLDSYGSYIVTTPDGCSVKVWSLNSSGLEKLLDRCSQLKARIAPLFNIEENLKKVLREYLLNGGHKGSVVKVNKRYLIKTAEKLWPSLQYDPMFKNYFAHLTTLMLSNTIKSGFLEELGYKVLKRKEGYILLVRSR